ncbi:hypothetical protein LMH87_003975 [Akanthomyces muscarius]|uniref:Uncharacterized protein n=1 Tax=Akanthomyces muscarius TaxID=2231603 RepID=A0A9W8Q2V8_AKAMU|nr:hypothetical protein LMH87_003975 [Akanthomyces muscarius]KAJ4145115.1 hypothetical protein LMH87_003975 [Akanthomyces muscarius]
METSFVKFIGAATCAWVLSYLIDLLDLLPSEEGDMLRDAMPTYHCCPRRSASRAGADNNTHGTGRPRDLAWLLSGIKFLIEGLRFT